MNEKQREVNDRMIECGLSSVGVWNPEKIIKFDQNLKFHCLTHFTDCRANVYTAIKTRENGKAIDTCPGCVECRDEKLRVNALKARESRATGDAHSRYDTFAKHVRLVERATAPCRFYIARLNNKYIKPGIAKIPENRASQAKGQGHPYKSFEYISEVYQRAIVFVAEQYCLASTQDLLPKKPPQWLRDGSWTGSTEVREVEPEYILQLFKYAMKIMLESGDWQDFYKTRVLPIMGTDLQLRNGLPTYEEWF